MFAGVPSSRGEEGPSQSRAASLSSPPALAGSCVWVSFLLTLGDTPEHGGGQWRLPSQGCHLGSQGFGGEHLGWLTLTPAEFLSLYPTAACTGHPWFS